MLKELRVRNFAIIEELTLRFAPGLNVLTGETGAGKSIIIGALGIALGQRAYTEMIRTGADEASVEASFEAEGHPLLERLGIPAEEGINIRRQISAAGKTRAYINDTSVGVQSLAELGRTLVDIHGQHEHQSLLSSDNQLRLLDHYGGLDGERRRVAELFDEAQELERRLADLGRSARERAQRLDLLRFQVAEIEAAAPEEGEDRKLEGERAILANLQRLNELLEESYLLLYGAEGSGLEKLSSAVSRLREMASIDEKVAEPLSVLESALPLVEDASFTLRNFKDTYEMDPGRLDMVEERLERLRDLKRKYGDSIGEVIDYGNRARQEAAALENSDEISEGLKEELAQKRAGLDSAAAGLSRGRAEAARALAGAVKKILKDLALEKADFAVQMKAVPVASSGADGVEFLFSANRGEALKPLSKVASGGELSRVMLAVKSVLRDSDDIPVLIFDEVDAGIGGKTAHNVARKLKEISVGRQVLCITHLPQIASVADAHLLIEKALEKGGTRVTVMEVSGRQRQLEIARMLGGRVTETSLRHAKEIIEGG